MDRITNWIQITQREMEHQRKAHAKQPTMTKECSNSQPCPVCKGAGYLRVEVPVGHPQFGKPFPCQCSIEQIQQHKQQKLIKLSGIDTLECFRAASFETYNPFIQGVRQAYMQAFEFACQPKGWLILVGEYGCGKTHLAVSIAKKQIEAGNLVLFQVVPRLLDYLRAAFSPNAEQDYDERFQQLCNTDLLILDDFGTQNNTPWAADKLFQLLNHRYNAQAPTVITMNAASWEQVEARLHSRFNDKHLVHLIKMDHAQDYRIHGQ
ncbi:ATP-binding protein [Dictyobacter kobayashii]|uniref:ATP-binding protein n=1 Tax=Dictyobacter kobayashii TaxID=2014872 RepID=A0A402AW11_9CHLR|nr:ATP-binding protein [Dictyobacter kobayashii]GCE23277.1 ATP-binding protein [Dictyobacter kobayashii]